MNTASLLWGVLFGSVGVGFFMYGRRQQSAVPLVVGVALICVPYFVSNTWLLVGIGAVLVALPYFLRL